MESIIEGQTSNAGRNGRNDRNEHQVRRRQWRMFFVFAVVFASGGFVMKFVLSDSQTGSSPTVQQKAHFDGAMESVNSESVVLEKTQHTLNDSVKKTQTLQSEVDSMKKKFAELEAMANVSSDLEKRLLSIEKNVGQKNSSPPLSGSPVTTVNNSREAWQGNLFPPASGALVAEMPQSAGQGIAGIREDRLNLTPRPDYDKNRLPVRNPDTYVPAGTFVRAVMLGGADASAAVNASSDPLVMVFRILDKGTLPNHKKSHLKDCVALASVWGDISSERGQIRLTNLSCTFPDKRIVDQGVEGTVFGPGGKNGVRGTPVWREGALLQRAFTAGALSGFSEGLSQTYTSNSISPQGAVQTVNPASIFSFGAAKGTGKAMDKLADYNIQRAEQYHPVIQISAGTVVDIVFQKGFFLDGNDHAHEISDEVSNRENRTNRDGLVGINTFRGEQAAGQAQEKVMTLFPQAGAST